MGTIRQRMMSRLSEEEMSALDLSRAMGIREKEVYEHLPHVSRSAKTLKKKLAVRPAKCQECGYGFKDRTRFTPPSRCPHCKSEWIDVPLYRISSA